jgi:hypothetical protein
MARGVGDPALPEPVWLVGDGEDLRNDPRALDGTECPLVELDGAAASATVSIAVRVLSLIAARSPGPFAGR